jgi:23S rRNA (uridine2552-2'-O)-methyltransferase
MYAAEKVGPKGLVVGVDLAIPQGSFPEWVKLLAVDLLSVGDAETWGAEFFQLGADGVLSDLAPKTTGRREVDQARSLELALAAWSWAERLLKPGGFFLFKVFQSPAADEFIQRARVRFQKLIRLKPQASRKQSQEIFALLKGFKAE